MVAKLGVWYEFVQSGTFLSPMHVLNHRVLFFHCSKLITYFNSNPYFQVCFVVLLASIDFTSQHLLKHHVGDKLEFYCRHQRAKHRYALRFPR
jgi:hypothetical protein